MSLCSVGIAAVAIAAASADAKSMEGQRILAVDRFGSAEYSTLNLRVNGTSVHGDWDGDVAKGSFLAGTLRLSVTDRRGAIYRFEARLVDGALREASTVPEPLSLEPILGGVFMISWSR